MDRDLDNGKLDDDLPLVTEGDDEIDVTFTDEPETPFAFEPKDKEVVRRGQNEGEEEGPESEEDDGADPDLSDIKDRDARSRIMAERRAVQSKTREFLKQEETWQRQLLSSELRNAAIQRDSAKMALDGIDLRIRTATEAMKSAAIDEDKSSVIDLEAQIRELHRVRGDIQAMTEKIPRDDELKGRFEAYRAKRQSEVLASTRDEGIRPQSQLAQTWASANTWMNNPKYAIETSAVVAMSNALAGEGYDINSQAHFVELSKRMAKKFPTLAVKDNHGRALTAQPNKQVKTDAPPVASARNAQVSVSRTNGKVKAQVQLDGNDRRMMRVLGMDPADKKAASRFAKEKLTRLRSEQRAG
jgi:hypothetical protein